MMDFFDAILDWFLDVLLWIPEKVMEMLADAVEEFMSWLPQDTIDITGALTGISGDILYFLTLFEFGYGLTVIFGALVARFILRRIPGIG